MSQPNSTTFTEHFERIGEALPALIHRLEVIAKTTLHATVEGSSRSKERDDVRQAAALLAALSAAPQASTGSPTCAYCGREQQSGYSCVDGCHYSASPAKSSASSPDTHKSGVGITASDDVFRKAIRDCGQPDQWELDDARVDWLTVQIDKDDWIACQKALAMAQPPPQPDTDDSDARTRVVVLERQIEELTRQSSVQEVAMSAMVEDHQTQIAALTAEMERQRESVKSAVLAECSTMRHHIAELDQRVKTLDAVSEDRREQIAESAIENAALTAERDQLAYRLQTWTDAWTEGHLSAVQTRDERIAQLEGALRPFGKYIRARLSVFPQQSRSAYPELMVSSGTVTADLCREDWDRVAALSPAPPPPTLRCDSCDTEDPKANVELIPICDGCFAATQVSLQPTRGFLAGGRLLKYRCGTKEAAGVR